MSANRTVTDTLTSGEAAKLLRVCRQTIIKWADDDDDIPSWGAPRVGTGGSPPPSSAPAAMRPGGTPNAPSTSGSRRGRVTLEQVMTAAADHFAASGDVRRARMIRQVRGRLVPRIRRG
jgi:hypothetical protein